VANYCLICIGGLLFIGGAIWWLNIWVFLVRAVETTGQIVGEDSMHAKYGTSYAPVVEFQGPDGQAVKFTEKIYGAGEGTNAISIVLILAKMLWLKQSGRDVHAEISKVKVVYDPNKPERAYIKSFQYLHLVPILLIAIGICIGMAGTPLLSGVIASFVQFLTNITDKIPWWF
jgi:Protein of unknown function (DUF3592)